MPARTSEAVLRGPKPEPMGCWGVIIPPTLDVRARAKSSRTDEFWRPMASLPSQPDHEERDAMTTVDRTTMPTEMPDSRRWLALVVLCVGMLMIVLDVTVVNVALPSIQTDLGFSQSSLAWVVNAYLISFGGLLLLAGRFGDILGRKSVFLAGLAVFTVASFLCGISQSQGLLVASR